MEDFVNEYGQAFDPFRPSVQEPMQRAKNQEIDYYRPSVPRTNALRIEHLHPNRLPPVPPSVIEGVLRRGAVMIVSGPSKAGKTFLLLELSCAIATNTKWLGLQCVAGRVLYLNLEVEAGEFMHRLNHVVRESNFTDAEMHSCIELIGISHLRGRVFGIDQLVSSVISSVNPGDYDAIIIDPSYKVMTGDENAARDVHQFTNALDRLASATGAAVIYCHHHSKGTKGDTRSIDRFSGSGVFARHADAILDIIELNVDDDTRKLSGLSDFPCFRIDVTTRSFKKPNGFDMYFKYPRHYRDYEGLLADCKPDSPQQRGASASQTKALETRLFIEQTTSELLKNRESISLQALSDYVGKNYRTVRDHIRASDLYELEKRGGSYFVLPK